MCGRLLLPNERHLCLVCSSSIEPPVFTLSDILKRFGPEVAIDAHYSLFIYGHDEVTATMIRTGKYADSPHYFVTLGRLLAAHLCERKALTGVDALVPVPMYWFKQIRRGYNQTHIIALEISRATEIPVVKALRAVRPHARMAGSSAQHRATAVRGLFAPQRRGMLEGKRVAIVDDVLTSGSTLSEAARAAYAAGAVSVITVTLATAVAATTTDTFH